VNELYRWLASQAAKRWVSLALVTCVMVVDLGLPWQGWGFGARALVDEPCHQATGLVCLGAITRFRGRPPSPGFGWAMLVCSNVIDVDHLPQLFGSDVLTAGTPRPYTHALWVVVVLALAALIAHFRSPLAGSPLAGRPAAAAVILLGAACGLADHFMRDIAYAPISLWWPITRAPVEVSYWWYASAIVVIAVIPVTRRRRRSR
jgi:hypothetical protein